MLDGVAGKRLRFVVPKRHSLCVKLVEADAANFINDGVVARVLLQTMRFG